MKLKLLLLVEDYSYYNYNGELVFVKNDVKGKQLTHKQVLVKLRQLGY